MSRQVTWVEVTGMAIIIQLRVILVRFLRLLFAAAQVAMVFLAAVHATFTAN